MLVNFFQGLRDAGVPVLRLEREYAFSGEGQIKTRVQAFLEKRPAAFADRVSTDMPDFYPWWK